VEEAFAKGTLIAERYRLERRLGEGGMGLVWAAVDEQTHEPVAIKFLKGAKHEDRKRFQREVRAASAIRHPNVVVVHDLLELPDGTLAMAMELLEGETLGEVLRRQHRIALPTLAAVMLPVLDALSRAHAEGVFHRDLKPENVFLVHQSKDGEDLVQVKILDFGIAKLTAAEGLAARTEALTGSGSMVGTPFYMSPEQVFSEKDLDGRSDIWSLGIMMYECLCGERPTEEENVGRVLKRILHAEFPPIASKCDGLPEDVAALVMNMLVADREKRTRALAEISSVLTRHAAPSIRLPLPIDPHGDTMRPPDAPASNASTSHAATTPSGDALSPLAKSATPTSAGVSMALDASRTQSRSRARLFVVATVLAVLGVGAYGLSGVFSTRDTTATTPSSDSTSAPITQDAFAATVELAAPSSSTSASATIAQPSASSVPSASASPPPNVARTSVRPPPAAPTQAGPAASATVAAAAAVPSSAPPAAPAAAPSVAPSGAPSAKVPRIAKGPKD
jgi:serine/threonine-protein kinase